MRRVLAVVRRLFWGGSISLCICIFLLKIEIDRLIGTAFAINSIQSFAALFFLLSPLLFLLFAVISVIYIRKKGQFAEIHQEQSAIVTFFRCWWSDIISPFKNIKNFIVALFNKNAVVMGKGIIIGRFIELIIIVLMCVAGVCILML